MPLNEFNNLVVSLVPCIVERGLEENNDTTHNTTEKEHKSRTLPLEDVRQGRVKLNAIMRNSIWQNVAAKGLPLSGKYNVMNTKCEEAEMAGVRTSRIFVLAPLCRRTSAHRYRPLNAAVCRAVYSRKKGK